MKFATLGLFLFVCSVFLSAFKSQLVLLLVSLTLFGTQQTSHPEKITSTNIVIWPWAYSIISECLALQASLCVCYVCLYISVDLLRTC